MDSAWFRDAAFGAFIHWGLYAVPGGIWKGKETDYIGEWLQARLRIPNAEYAELAKTFNPVRFDADEWCRCFAEAGMKYIVFTAKHHEGFSMFRTAVSPYNIVTGTPFRKFGLKLGIYYSHCLDWHEKDAAAPARDSSTNIDGSSWGNDWDFPDAGEKVFERYFRVKVIPQIRELLTQYGPVSVLWFDCACGITEAQCRELRELVHTLQPDCLINGRIGFGCQDYMSLGDNQMPGSAIPGLVECPDGAFPEESVRILHEIGLWHRRGGSGIHSASGTPFRQHIDGVFVLRNGRSLLFYPEEGARRITFSGIRAKVLECPLPFTQTDRTLTIDFPDSGGMYPCFEVKFDAVPEVPEALMPQNGVLFLAPADGKIIRGTEDADSADAVDADAKTIRTGAHMSLTGDGQLCSWHNPSDRIEWAAELTEPGVYKVLLTTRSMRHSFPWTGKRTVEISVGGRTLAGELTADAPPHDAYYPCADSALGEIRIGSPRTVSVVLRSVGIHSADALMMACRGVTYILCTGGNRKNLTEPFRGVIIPANRQLFRNEVKYHAEHTNFSCKSLFAAVRSLFSRNGHGKSAVFKNPRSICQFRQKNVSESRYACL